mmetsp:Transcript_9532/g.22250  ORF Transcript_9532/g.22250 Transcript_9532/m.22250 type:complete len:115 (-) Transcript_9532:181-525(-)
MLRQPSAPPPPQFDPLNPQRLHYGAVFVPVPQAQPTAPPPAYTQQPAQAYAQPAYAQPPPPAYSPQMAQSVPISMPMAQTHAAAMPVMPAQGVPIATGVVVEVVRPGPSMSAKQ